MKYVVHDTKYNFKFAFDTKTGAYVRTGILSESIKSGLKGLKINRLIELK